MFTLSHIGIYAVRRLIIVNTGSAVMYLRKNDIDDPSTLIPGVAREFIWVPSIGWCNIS